MTRDPSKKRTVATNRRARHSYEIIDELELGVQLLGTEVKSLRAGRCSIEEAFGLFRGTDLYLVGATIPEYSHGNINNHAPDRERRLLAHRKELARWEGKVRERGMTLVPLEVFFAGHLVKVQMALVRGKRQHDKRARSAERDAKREIDRAMRRRR